MNITDIKIRLINNDSRMRAVVSVTFDDEFVVHDIKVIQGPEKVFLAMPSRRLPEGGYCDIAHPISVQVRERIERAVLERYQAAVDEIQNTEAERGEE